jgi:hypothetical protein
VIFMVHVILIQYMNYKCTYIIHYVNYKNFVFFEKNDKIHFELNLN